MSIILVKKNKDSILIGADSQETAGKNCKENIRGSKLRKVQEGVYIAGSGDAHICSALYAYAEKTSIIDKNDAWSLMEYFSEFHEWIEELFRYNKEEEQPLLQRCQFILIIKDKIWHFADFYLREIKEGEFNAIGSGTQAALACMHLEDSVVKAIEATCKVDIYCSQPIEIIEIKINK